MSINYLYIVSANSSDFVRKSMEALCLLLILEVRNSMPRQEVDVLMKISNYALIYFLYLAFFSRTTETLPHTILKCLVKTRYRSTWTILHSPLFVDS